jgi:hypothetical protein
MSIPLDLDCYPLILQGFPRGRKSEDDLIALFDRMRAVGRRAVETGAIHVVVALGDEDFNAAERKLIAARMAQAPADEAACVVGAFAVIENTFARGVLTALKWLAPSVIPIVPASTPDEAIDLAEACLRSNGVVPAPIVVERARIHARKLHDGMRRSSPPSAHPPG